MNKVFLCAKSLLRDTIPSVRNMASVGSKLVEHDSNYIKNHLLKHPGGNVYLCKDDDEGIATICIDHPEKRNAMSGKMMVELRDCIEQLEEWKEGKAVILYGNNGCFCSGGDLDFAKATGSAQAAIDMSTWMQETLVRLQNLPLVSVCLLEGPALGGGAEISIFCDYMVAAENVKFGFVHCKMGLITAFGGATRLVQKIGQRKALDLFLTSRILTAKETLDVGLTDCVFPNAAVFEQTKSWLKERIKHHHSLVRAFKNVVSEAGDSSLTDSFKYERHRFAPFWGGELNKQALAKNIKHIENKKGKF